jgi:flavodoxin
MKSLVVYYSRTGKTRIVAEQIAKKLNADIEEIVDLKNRRGIIGYLSGGKDAMKKTLTKIKKSVKNPLGYDLVVIGTPIWASKMVPAVRTYLKNSKIKKAAFFYTAGGSGSEKAFEDMKETIGKAKIMGQLGLSGKDIRTGHIEKLNMFIKKIKK